MREASENRRAGCENRKTLVGGKGLENHLDDILMNRGQSHHRRCSHECVIFH